MAKMTDIVERLRIGRETCGVDMCRIREARSGCTCAEAADEIERLREALRYYAKNHYPDIDAGPWGPNSNDWGDVARSALGEKE